MNVRTIIPAGARRQGNVESTLVQHRCIDVDVTLYKRRDVAMTLMRRWSNVDPMLLWPHVTAGMVSNWAVRAHISGVKYSLAIYQPYTGKDRLYASIMSVRGR